jgi:hypothetical protein
MPYTNDTKKEYSELEREKEFDRPSIKNTLNEKDKL